LDFYIWKGKKKIINIRIIDKRTGLEETIGKEYPENFRECLFRVEHAYQYSEYKKFLFLLEKYNISEFDYKTTNSKLKKEEFEKLKEAQKNMEEEEINNLKEQERQVSEKKTLRYGQTIQLYHIKTGKYLTIKRESADLQKDAMKMSLEKKGNSSSLFYILPFFKYKIEGDETLYEENIRLFSKKFSLNLNVGKGVYYETGRKEINLSNNMENKWKIKRYSNDIKDRSLFKCGDIIRIYYKEFEGYLYVNETDEVQICNSESLKKYHSTTSLWEIQRNYVSTGKK
jgi:hypothetical protein